MGRVCERRQIYCTDRNLVGLVHERSSDFKHLFKAEGPVGGYRSAQWILSANVPERRRLAVVPFGSVENSVRADDAMARCNLMPEGGFSSAGPANAVHVYRKSVGMKRLELIRKPADAECWRSICGGNSGRW